MPVTIRPMPIADLWSAPNCDALIGEYAAESSIDGLPPINPHRELYDALERSGMFHMLGAFGDDQLVGFLILLVSLNPHYGQRLAITESFFVASSHRKTGAGLQLLRAAERLAIEQGAVGFLVSAPSGGRLAEVLPRTGYRETNRVFFRELAQ